MKIAFDITPLTSDHKFRGTGFYTLHLKNAFKRYFAKEHEFYFFSNPQNIPKNADIVHYPYFDPFSRTIPLKNAHKTIVTILDLTPLIFPKAFPAGIRGKIQWYTQKAAAKRLCGVITDSASAKRDIQRLVGIPEEKISVAYLAAGEQFVRFQNDIRIKELRKKYNIPEKFALYVGDVTWNKNLPRIISAAIQANVPLVLVGKAIKNPNFDKKNIWNADLIKVQQLAKHTNIFSVGFVPMDDLVLFYNTATAFVMPSLYEGFGLPILEAMACGCPVITSREGSLPEVAGEAAYYVNAYDTDDIAKGIKTVFSSLSLQKSLTQKGLVHNTLFSWKKTAEETLKAYENYLAK